MWKNQGSWNSFHAKLIPNSSIYSAALGLYNSRIVKLINKKKQLKSSVIIDELPTIYFRGLDNLIATARSNKMDSLIPASKISKPYTGNVCWCCVRQF